MSEKKIEASKAPPGSQPMDYEKRTVERPEGLPPIKEIRSDENADASDLMAFENRNPEYADNVEAMLKKRIREYPSGIRIDTVLLNIVADKIEKGLSKEPNRYASFYLLLADPDQFQTLMSFLKRLEELKVPEASKIKQQIDNFQGATQEQAALVRQYLADREKYLE